MRTFHLLCQCYFYVNGPFFQCLLPLIYFYIDSRDCWDCFLSVIAPIHPYMTPPPPLFMNLSLLFYPPTNFPVLCPVYTSPFLSMIPSINYLVCWWKAILIAGIVGIVISGIVGIVFCLFLQPSVLLMRHFYLSSQFVPLYAVLLMFPSLHIFLPLID